MSPGFDPGYWVLPSVERSIDGRSKDLFWNKVKVLVKKKNMLYVHAFSFSKFSFLLLFKNLPLGWGGGGEAYKVVTANVPASLPSNLNAACPFSTIPSAPEGSSLSQHGSRVYPASGQCLPARLPVSPPRHPLSVVSPCNTIIHYNTSLYNTFSKKKVKAALCESS